MVAVIFAIALGVTVARAEVTQQGNLRVSVTGTLSPHALPRSGTSAVSVSVAGNIATTDKSTPPHLKKMTIEINRHGVIDSTGLPTCRLAQIRAASSDRALAACRPALVGHGRFLGTITLPGSSPLPIEGRLLAFNGREHGKPALFAHIYSPRPFATSFVIVFKIGHKGHGTYGTVMTANLGTVLGNKRSLTGIELTLFRRYSYRGRPHSYVSAGCPAPKGFSSIPFPLARTSFAFADGRNLVEVLRETCKVRG
ncbi:MAG TPA: hypothetical protein VLC51_10215 [Nitrospira sp.]|nr:hypothetical protein [Nitrospira sp.]